MAPGLALTREQVLAFRRRVSALDERLLPGLESLRTAAWAGLTDSMPRAALLSIHARVEGTEPTAREDPSLVQVWGPRFSWTSRVWPGALLVGGEVAGTWRRANEKVSIQPWRRLTPREQEAVEAEAASLPLPGIQDRIRVRWDDG